MKKYLYLLFFFLLLNIVNAVNYNKGTIYYLPFDTDKTTDFSQNHNDFTNINGTFANGIYNRALNISVRNYYIINNTVANSNNNAFTDSLWIYPIDFNENSYFLWRGTCAVDHDMNTLFIKTNGTLSWTNCIDDTDTNITIGTNIWQHITETYDGNTIKIYINGSLKWYLSNTNAFFRIASKPKVVYGRHGDALTTANYRFLGLYDEIIFLNFTATQENVTDIFNGDFFNSSLPPALELYTNLINDSNVSMRMIETICINGTFTGDYATTIGNCDLIVDNKVNQTLSNINLTVSNCFNYTYNCIAEINLFSLNCSTIEVNKQTYTYVYYVDILNFCLNTAIQIINTYVVSIKNDTININTYVLNIWGELKMLPIVLFFFIMIIVTYLCSKFEKSFYGLLIFPIIEIVLYIIFINSETTFYSYSLINIISFFVIFILIFGFSFPKYIQKKEKNESNFYSRSNEKIY